MWMPSSKRWSTRFPRAMHTDSSSGVHVLFRLAAGSRLGYGHLVRGRALARALAIETPAVSLRGDAPAKRAARRFGMQLVEGGAVEVLRRFRPDVLVLDDPSLTSALPWCRAAHALH